MPKIEVCVDNLESVQTANQFANAIHRIELCSALSAGGISPSYSLLRQAIALSRIPLAVMIRVRAGDFLFSENEIQAMVDEIHFVKTLGVEHVVIGALTPSGEIDLTATKRLIDAAKGMEITFHRAFDLCRDPVIALEQLIELGVHRVLTSGQAATAFDGIPQLQKWVQQANGRIQIMAGCGVNAANVAQILRETQVPEIHFSAKGVRLSEMANESTATMGSDGEQDRQITVLDREKLLAILEQIGKTV